MEYAHDAQRADAQRAVPAGGSSHVNVGTMERVASAFGGGLLAYLGLHRRSLGGLLLAAVGGALLYRGASGHCPVFQQVGLNTAEGQPKPVHLQESLTVNMAREEVYAFWRRLENLPRFMRHLASVTEVDDTQSHWVARAPKDAVHVAWDAEITQDRENELIAWRSLPGAAVHNAGMVRFADAPGGRGTEVHVTIDYRPPAGVAGKAVASLLNPATAQLIKEDLRRFRSVLVAGEVPTVEGQPSGRPA